MSDPAQIFMNNAASPAMEELLFFHDYAMLLLMMIGISVMTTLAMITTTKLYCIMTTEADHLEFIWTLLPLLVLTFVATPSLRTLYLLEDLEYPHLTIKTIGHQWYWSYEYSDHNDITFDSYMIQDKNLEPGSLRLLEVDNRMVLPMQTTTRLLVTAEDVLHSWTVPSLGLKTDAIPGRLNQLIFTLMRPGIFYGQCSEICGANHSFMPIAVESIPTEHFENWINSW